MTATIYTDTIRQMMPADLKEFAATVETLLLDDLGPLNGAKTADLARGVQRYSCRTFLEEERAAQREEGIDV